MTKPKDIVTMLDRFERAAMAYERLGKLTRDDEKTRTIRLETIAELHSARSDLLNFVKAKDDQISNYGWAADNMREELDAAESRNPTWR